MQIEYVAGEDGTIINLWYDQEYNEHATRDTIKERVRGFHKKVLDARKTTGGN